MNPPKMFIDAKNVAKNPKIIDKLKSCELEAIRAPIIIIPDIALVIDIRGVCSAGVTFQTT
jgi:hypothetical protein